MREGEGSLRGSLHARNGAARWSKIPEAERDSRKGTFPCQTIWSPECPDAFPAADALVLGDEGDLIRYRGGHDQAVGRIAVKTVESAAADRNRRRQIEQLDPGDGKGCFEPLDRIEARLDGVRFDEESKLPKADGTDAETVRLLDRLCRAAAQAGWVVQPPEPCVGIEDDHRFASHSTSMGATMS